MAKILDKVSKLKKRHQTNLRTVVYILALQRLFGKKRY
ncbi:hypothetical protein LCGC14_0197040 [marine sediment metagenome]|uniref:Uncharacterized protein n=1 Tax=marine sediment metagenome TaxID=412755 RepID=A0A0F9UJT2_9ZZZZ